MTYSHEGIGQVAATFKAIDVQEGQVVKLTASNRVEPCEAGEDFCGVVLAVARDGQACTVALRGMVTVPYTTTAPALGWSAIGADGSGGVKAVADRREYLVVSLNASQSTVTFML